MKRWISALAAVPPFVFACSSPDEPVKLTPAQAGAKQASTAPTSGAAQGSSAGATAKPLVDVSKIPGHPPVGATKGLTFTAQEGWIVETPSSAVRKAQYRLTKVDGDPEDASLVVFYFGGEGGSVEANIERWAGQLQQPDGRASKDVMQRSTRTVNGLTVHDVDLSGTYVAETTPGSGERVNKEKWRLLASIVESDAGPYYAKLTGPEKSIARWEPSFRSFISQVKKAE